MQQAPFVAPRLMTYICNRGEAIIRRAYADWASPRQLAWRRVLRVLAIRPVQQLLRPEGVLHPGLKSSVVDHAQDPKVRCLSGR